MEKRIFLVPLFRNRFALGLLKKAALESNKEQIDFGEN